jgi:putative spermidine/putrescine transport system permease protein
MFFGGLAEAIIVSLGYLPGAGLDEFTLKYYVEVFQDKGFLQSLMLSLYIALASSLISVAAGVLISLVASTSGLIKSRLFRIVNIPIIVPHTVCALLIINLFAQSGLLARFTYAVGLVAVPGDFFPFLFSSNAFGIIIAYLWKEIPFVILVVATIMASLNSSLGEAAQNLGASRWRVFTSVILPLCLPAVTTTFIIIFAYSFGAYEIPYLLGATEPKALAVQTYVEYVYPSLDHRPYTMVMNSTMIFLTVAFSYLYYRLQKKLVRATGSDV